MDVVCDYQTLDILSMGKRIELERVEKLKKSKLETEFGTQNLCGTENASKDEFIKRKTSNSWQAHDMN